MRKPERCDCGHPKEDHNDDGKGSCSKCWDCDKFSADPKQDDDDDYELWSV